MNFSERDCFILDGGLGIEIEKKGYPELQSDPLWSARLLRSNPQALEDIHLDFLRAGAEIIITASYQASIPLLRDELGVSTDDAINIIKESVAIAFRARSKYLEESKGKTNDQGLPLVAGSVGPYGACLHNMSEYTGSYVDHVSRDEMKAWHRPRIAALLEAGVHLLACETIPALVEAEVLIDLLTEFPEAKAWISFSCKDHTHTCYGDKFATALAKVSRSPQVVAVGTNCTDPRYITSLLESAQGATSLPLVVYPDGKDYWDDATGTFVRGSLDLERGFPDHVVKKWRSLGARVIGGCCHVNPSNIRDIKLALTQ